MRALAGVLVAAAALAACASPQGAPIAPGDEAGPAARDHLAALDAFSEEWRRAYQSGDFAALEDLYEEDAWLMTRSQPARKGRAAILDYFASSRAAGAEARIVFEPEDVAIDPPYAFKIARWWLESPQAKGEPVRDSGRSLVVFKLGADGRWRLWRDIDNRTPDAAFPMPEPMPEEIAP